MINAIRPAIPSIKVALKLTTAEETQWIMYEYSHARQVIKANLTSITKLCFKGNLPSIKLAWTLENNFNTYHMQNEILRSRRAILNTEYQEQVKNLSKHADFTRMTRIGD